MSVISVSGVSVAYKTFNLTVVATGPGEPYLIQITAFPNGDATDQYPQISGISSGVPQVLTYTLSEAVAVGSTLNYVIDCYNYAYAHVDTYHGSVVAVAPPLPNEAVAVNTDFAGTSAIVNWTPGAGATSFRLVAGGSGTTPPNLPTPFQGASNYSWVGSLLNSTTYSGLIQSSADTVNWTAGVPFSFTTSAPTVLSAVQTSATTTTATIEVHPISTNTTITCPGYTVSPSGAQPQTITTYTISGLSPGQSATATITPSAGAPITQVVLATPSAPSSLTARLGATGLVLDWTTPSPAIAGSPYLVITSNPPVANQPLYPAYAKPFTITGVPINVPYIFYVSFGQENAGGTEGAITGVVMAEAVITSVNGNKVYWNSFGTLSVPYNLYFGDTLLGTLATSPFIIPTGLITPGTTASLQIRDNSGYLGPLFTYTYNPVQAGINFLLAP